MYEIFAYGIIIIIVYLFLRKDNEPNEQIREYTLHKHWTSITCTVHVDMCGIIL